MSDVVRTVVGYKTSEDYKKLWALAQRQSVVCLVDHRGGDCVDVAQTLALKEWVEVSVRGLCYVWAEAEEDFVNQCERNNLRWLVPAHPVE